MNYDYYVGKPITIITPITNQPITPDSSVNLFTGILEQYDKEAFAVRLLDGTLGTFFRGPSLIALIENEIVGSEDPRFQSLVRKPPCSGVHTSKSDMGGDDGSEEADRPKDPKLCLPPEKR